ncbi:hypothetical protein EC973_000305 [Apophysomyces ossiformis]|uniref:Arsenate reductase n=1 Tax=Apophysomyces ossiformis TaxID=679940 RepID=A0A8H7BLV3_9FUNG|nr:hypothetical protein EC973_000305 [Apophysomyces ossiformis]
MVLLTIYHNPKCSKSRNALAILQENQTKDGKVNYELDVVRYHTAPPSTETLQQLVDYLGLADKDAATRPWDDLLRPEAKKKADSWEEVFQMIQKDPALLERPFVVDWDRRKAALGRPDTSGVEELVATRVQQNA